jgi:protoporphyrinogen oxidase
MESVRTLIIGAGISGLATAAFSPHQDYLVLERDGEMGGYCKTVKKDGFVWDYSGHFFHFKHADIEAYLRARMPEGSVRTVQKRTFIDYERTWVDFPFQKNIHQLPREDFIDCLYDLYMARSSDVARSEQPEHNFKDMLYARFGRSIAEKFLVPYNEKLYATDLATLDKEAMGRFFPHADLSDVIRNMREPDNGSYNATFTYPIGGAIEYVMALAREVDPSRIALNEALVSVDLEARVARTTRRQLRFEHLVSSAPFPHLLRACGVPHDGALFTCNKVLIFNLGFDRKGARDVHWVYYPSRELCFYRIGYYDNIIDGPRMSLYVEIGYPSDAQVDADAMLARTLADLKRVGVIDQHELVAHHSVVLDPAYVHITQASLAEQARLSGELSARGVHAIGRYGGWTYCSIEDNIVEARALAAKLG